MRTILLLAGLGLVAAGTGDPVLAGSSAPAAKINAAPPGAAGPVSPERRRLEQSLRLPIAGPRFLFATLWIAFFLGAAHALTPGHGKAIVAAYLVGSRGRVWDAVYLGSVVTLTHTCSVFVLGLLTLFASQYILMDRIYPWLSALSGLLVFGMGLWLLRSRWRGAGGHLVPARHHAGHHSPHAHQHPPQQQTSQSGASRWNLASLGVSGGLVPCPEALVVLLISISLGRLILGLAILVAFSLGLAVVLIAIGVAMVVAGPLLGGFSRDSWLTRALPLGSAAVVTLLGAGILYQAVVDNRWIRF